MTRANVRFELSLWGGATERRYRRLRPEVERLPWGTLDPTRYPAELVLAARRSWTLAAFQEHRTGAACAATLEALIAARAPVDLIAVAARFPLDELAHVHGHRGEVEGGLDERVIEIENAQSHAETVSQACYHGLSS